MVSVPSANLLITQYWVQCFAQGHFDMQTEGDRDQTTDLLILLFVLILLQPVK